MFVLDDMQKHVAISKHTQGGDMKRAMRRWSSEGERSARVPQQLLCQSRHWKKPVMQIDSAASPKCTNTDKNHETCNASLEKVTRVSQQFLGTTMFRVHHLEELRCAAPHFFLQFSC